MLTEVADNPQSDTQRWLCQSVMSCLYLAFFVRRRRRYITTKLLRGTHNALFSSRSLWEIQCAAGFKRFRDTSQLESLRSLHILVCVIFFFGYILRHCR